MGCDIHSYAEVNRNDKWEMVTDHFDINYYKKEKGDSPFTWRSYSLFAFLAGVRNYDRCEPISELKGLPDDISDGVSDEYGSDSIYDCDYHSLTFLTLKELLDFDYDKVFWNRRVTKQISPNCSDGAALAEEGEGKMISYRDNLGLSFFNVIDELKELGEPENVRIVFWFDS